MNIAIIPARKNSIRIKNKNKKLFFKKPIIEYSIIEAKKTKLFDYIFVSTDCNEIANISKKAGANVLKRSSRLAQNEVGIVEVVKDSVFKIKNKKINPKYICCIFPAAPLIEKKKILEGFNKIKKNKYSFVFSASKANLEIFRLFSLTTKKKIKLLFNKSLFNKKINKSLFFDAGQFYWAKVNKWMTEKTVFSSKASIIEIDRTKVQDINNLDDWKFAEFLFKSNKKN